jgi:hypothetical protein
MNWLVIGWFLTLGVVPQQEEIIGSGISNAVADPFPSEVTVGLDATVADHFIIGFSVENFMSDVDGSDFSPYRTDYHFSTGVRLNEHVSFWFENECIRPVRCELHSFSGQETKLYLKLEGKEKLW